MSLASEAPSRSTRTHSQAPAPRLGADLVLRALEAEGVDVCFGMPGGAILPLYDALARGTTIRHVLVAHEQGAGHMAQGYARASGRPGVVFATSGPGATNLVTPIADARMDSTPLVCITGQVRQQLIGTQAFQECDINSVVRPLVKRAWQVRDPAELASVVREAVRLAGAGRPGPVLVDVPRDVQEAAVIRSAEPSSAAPGDREPDPAQLDAVVAEIEASRRPVLYVGGGAQGSAAAVRELAERAQIPVVCTLMGKGAFPESHELFVGWPGMHGLKSANWAFHHADLLIAAGARFDDRVTGRLDAFAPRARVVHVDVDRTEFGKIRAPEVAVQGSVDAVLGGVVRRGGGFGDAAARTREWRRTIAGWRRRFPLGYAAGRSGARLKPQWVLERLDRRARELPEVIWTTGVGQHQMWAMQYARCERPRSFITSGGHGTMGFGLPAALGAKAARPEATVICVDGDGSFQMTCQELATAVRAELPVVVVILENQSLGMVRQWQSLFYAQRHSQVDLAVALPDYAAIARGYGALGFTVEDGDELDAALAEAFAANRAAVVSVRVDPDEHCYPMILPGAPAAEQVEWHEAAP